MTREESIVGCLLGTATADAIGLPFEAMSRQRQRRLCPDIKGHHFFFGRGMTSDDTEHSCMVAQALIVSGGDAKQFGKALSRQFRWWLAALPASAGFATLRAILKLWIGFPAHRSGVFSAGNGPAMRSPIIGASCGYDTPKLREVLRVSTRITHTDPKAEFGAVAVAMAAYMSSKQTAGNISPLDFASAVRGALGSEAKEFLDLLQKAAESVAGGTETESFAEQFGRHGVSGYVYHTVPVALHAWLRNQTDYRSGVLEVIRCGGDTDSTAAITGGIIGARVGRAGIPSEWLNGISDWPRTVQWMEDLARRLSKSSATSSKERPLPLPVYGVLLRNLLFILIVLAHGFRRMLPPY